MNIIIYLVTSLLVILVVSFYKLGKYKSDSRELGKNLLIIDMDTQKLSYKMQLFRVFLGILILLLYIYYKRTILDKFVIIFVCIFSFMLSKFIFPFFMKNEKLGLYTNGVVTVYGVKFYEEVKYYGFTEEDNNDMCTLVFVNKIPLLNQGSYIQVKVSSKQRIIKTLNNRCTHTENLNFQKSKKFFNKK